MSLSPLAWAKTAAVPNAFSANVQAPPGVGRRLQLGKMPGQSQQVLRSQKRAAEVARLGEEGLARWRKAAREAKAACSDATQAYLKEATAANKAAIADCKVAQRAAHEAQLRQVGHPASVASRAPQVQSQAAAAQRLAEPEMSLLESSCPAPDNVVFANPLTLHVQRIGYYLSSGDDVVASTSNLHVPPELEGDEWTPDSVMAVLYCGYDPLCTSGEVVEVDDDGNTDTTGSDELRDSKIEFTAAASGFYWVIVYAYEPFSFGIADMSITIDSVETLTGSDDVNRIFGGYHTVMWTKPGDGLYVGVSPMECWLDHELGPEYHDSVLFQFNRDQSECTSDCGEFRHNDDVTVGDATSTLSRILSDEEDDEWAGRVLVGTAGDWHAMPGESLAYNLENVVAMSARLFHVRKHDDDGGEWTCDEQHDHDGDGLPVELEDYFGSCDTLHGEPLGTGLGVNGFACRDFAELIADGLQEYDDRRVNYNFTDETDLDTCTLPSETDDVAGWSDTNPNCWRAVDSDNDVLQDPWEVWAVFFACDQSPAGPLYTAGNCVPLPLAATSCPGGKWCTVEDLSSDSGVSPDVYDVLVDSIAFRSTSEFSAPGWCLSMMCTEANHDHGWGDTNAPSGDTESSVPADQAAFFERVFTEEPQECWDGSTDQPCLDPERDLPYRARLHVYNRGFVDIADDSFYGEAHAGLRHDQIWHNNQIFNWGFRTARRWAKISRRIITSHHGGGGATLEGTVVGNTRKAVYDAVAAVHEVAHNLRLRHLQRDIPKEVGTDCESSCGQTDGSPRAWPIPHLSILGSSYAFMGTSISNGMTAKSDNASPPTEPINFGAECKPSNHRFSKGLNPTLDESALQELMTLGSDHWRAKKLATELRCFIAAGQHCDPNEFGTDGTDASMIGPSCTSTTCSFDWNRNEMYDSGTMSFDLSYGDYDQDDLCKNDVLYDLDEWRKLVSVGRTTYPNAYASHSNYLIYTTSFNGGHAENDAGWSFDVDSDGAFTDARYPINWCDGGSCRTDTCTTSADCRVGNTCTSGICQCSDHSDCFSEVCKLSGECLATVGARGCFSDSQCDGPNQHCDDDGPFQFCTTYEVGTEAEPHVPDAGAGYWPQPPRLAMSFGGPGSGAYLKLDNTGSTSALHSMVTNGALQVYLDFKLRGFATGETEQVLFSNDAFDIRIFKDGELATVVLNGDSAKPIWRSIWPNTWYRLRFGWTDFGNLHFLESVALDASSGTYDYASAGGIWRPWTAAVTVSGDFWFGYDGSDNSTRFRGEIDNISILNYLPNNEAPATCTEVP